MFFVDAARLPEQRRLRAEVVVADHPLLLSAAAALRGADRTLDAVDRPAVAPGCRLDRFVREHRQHEPALHRCEQLQKFLHVPLAERILVVAAVGVHIRRVDKVEGISRIIACNNIQGIAVPDGHTLETGAYLLRKLILRIAQFLGHHAPEVVAERTVQHRGERHLAQRPHSPRSLHGCEELRMGVDMRRVGMDVAAVQRAVDLALQVGIVHLGTPVEVGQLGVYVVYDLRLGRMASEWYDTHTVLKDYMGREVVVDEEVFATHTSKKYARTRVPLLEYIGDVLAYPDEMWLNDYVDEFKNLNFIKFYDGKVIDVICEVTENLEYRVTTWFEIVQTPKIREKSRSSRRIDPRWRYRRGLLIKKS